MKKSHKIILAALAVLLVVLYLAVPQKAVKGEYQIHTVEKNGLDITVHLTEESLDQIKDLLENTTCTRWKNPIGVYRNADNTVNIIGTDDGGLRIFNLVGADKKYGVNDHIIQDGETLWKAVLDIVP